MGLRYTEGNYNIKGILAADFILQLGAIVWWTNQKAELDKR